MYFGHAIDGATLILTLISIATLRDVCHHKTKQIKRTGHRCMCPWWNTSLSVFSINVGEELSVSGIDVLGMYSLFNKFVVFFFLIHINHFQYIKRSVNRALDAEVWETSLVQGWMMEPSNPLYPKP